MVIENKSCGAVTKVKRFSVDNYTFSSPISKIPSGHVRSLCNLYDKELKERDYSPTKGSFRNVGKLPGFEDYPATNLNGSFDGGKRNFVNLNRSRSFNCSSLSSTQDSPSSISSSSCQQDIKSSTSSPDSTRSNNSDMNSSPTSIETEKVKYTSFKGLFRSRSWSLKRKKGRIEVKTMDNQRSSHPNSKTETPK